MIAFKSIPHCKLDESLGVKYSWEWFIFLAHTSLPNASLVSANCLLDTQMSNWNVNFNRYRPSKLFHPQLSPWSSWKRHQMLKLKTRVQSCILSFLSTQVPHKKILLAPTSKYNSYLNTPHLLPCNGSSPLYLPPGYCAGLLAIFLIHFLFLCNLISLHLLLCIR